MRKMQWIGGQEKFSQCTKPFNQSTILTDLLHVQGFQKGGHDSLHTQAHA